MLIRIKPLSVNACRQWKRFKTKDYLRYEQMLMLMLPNNIIIPKIKFWLLMVVWYSSPNADIDNFLKPFLDCLSKKYHFNDKQIYEIHLRKNITKKWQEYIRFEFYQLRSS